MPYSVVKHTPAVPLLPPEQLSDVVTTFYDRVYAHPWIGQYFARVDRRIQEFNLVLFIQMSWDDRAYPKRQMQYMHHAHAHLFITDELFDLRQELFGAALRHHGHGDDVIEAFGEFNERWRSTMVKASVDECSDMIAEIVAPARPSSPSSPESAPHG